MKLYSEKENCYKLYHGNMLDMAEVIEPNSIDSIVTDPPYELNFMNKGWDNSGIAFQPNTWKKCYDVLKPGGYLLAFGGSRTFHRIAVAIEDAGFEIRDTIMWLYGCLSNDTEILTSNGWKNSENITTDDEIYSLDLEKDIIIKNKCLNVFKYDYNGEMVNLKNDNTNQLLTPNHHCIVKDKIKTQIKGETKYNTHNYWNYKDAWQIRSQTVKLPLAGNYDGKLEIGNLFAELLGWIISEGTYLKDTNAIMITQSSVNQKYVERIRYILGKLHIKYSEYSRERTYKNKTYTEYDFYIGKQAEKIVNKIKELAPNKKLNWSLLELSLSNKEFLIKGLLQGDGTKSNNALGFNAFYQKDIEELQIFQTLLHLTGKQGRINEKKYSCSIHNNPITELQGKHFKDRFVKYNGKYVWCIETEIGNFIARRDGKIFITGNSGFPKSMNIGKGIEGKLTIGSANVKDKKNLDGEKTKVTCGFNKMGKETGYRDKEYEMFKTEVNYHTDLGKQWSGWGTALKPSYEPIIVARKPVEGSITDNVLKNGVGGINIDECRVETGDIILKNIAYKEEKQSDGWETKKCITELSNIGRFPANTVLTYDESNYEEVCGGMPYTKNSGAPLTMPDLRDVGKKSKEAIGIDKLSFGQVSGAKRKPYVYAGREYNNKDTSMFNGDKPQAPSNYNDEGSASRYFMNCEFNDKDDDEEVLKPFCEPIIVARNPCEGTTTDNVLKYGVGGINIDECRVPLEDGYEFKQTTRHPRTNDVFTDETCGFKAETNTIASANPNDRFPANTILTYDETDEEEVCGGFPFRNNPNGSIKNPNLKNSLGNNGIFHKYSENQPLWQSYEDGGSAARYFYCAKASKKDRDEGCDTLNDGLLRRMRPDKDDSNPTGLNKEGRFAPVVRKNTHPTVKPTELMQYLVRLVSPNGATILDPFNGSGSTGKAVMYENKERNKNYKYIGIELTEEYLPIAKARIEYVIGIQTIPMVTLTGQTVTAMTNKPTPQPKKNILF